MEARQARHPWLGGWRWPLLLLAAGAALAAAKLGHWLAGDINLGFAIDYKTFFIASHWPLAWLYTGPPFAFIYPPTAIPFLRLVRLADYWPGYFILLAVSVPLFLLAARRAGPLRLGLLSLLSFSALQALMWGQVTLLLAAALLGAASLRGIPRGLALGLLAALKPQMVIAAPLFFLFRRDWRALAAIAAGGLVLVAASLAAFGLQPWLDWLAALPRIKPFLVQTVMTAATVTPAGLAAKLGQPLLPFLLADLAVAAALLWLARGRDEPAVLAATIAGCSVLASPYALPHDLIALMPLAVARLLGPPDPRQLPALALFGGVLLPLSLPLFLAAELLPARATPAVAKPGPAD